MKTLKTLRVPLAALLTALTLACSRSPSAPSGPSVDGVWTGTWGTTGIQMTLHQSGSSVTGELQVGSSTSSLTGEVSDAGTFSWGTQPPQGTCTVFSSTDFQLQNGGDNMSGVMTRASRPVPCGSGSRVQVTQGNASVSRAF